MKKEFMPEFIEDLKKTIGAVFCFNYFIPEVMMPKGTILKMGTLLCVLGLSENLCATEQKEIFPPVGIAEILSSKVHYNPALQSRIPGIDAVVKKKIFQIILEENYHEFINKTSDFQDVAVYNAEQTPADVIQTINEGGVWDKKDAWALLKLSPAKRLKFLEDQSNSGKRLRLYETDVFILMLGMNKEQEEAFKKIKTNAPSHYYQHFGTMVDDMIKRYRETGSLIVPIGTRNILCDKALCTYSPLQNTRV